jgi:NADH:ubiquinone oxidoreductase subunit 6 (subunit J)
VTPFGPKIWGVPWLVYLFVGVVFALFLAVSYSRKPATSRQETLDLLERIEDEREIEKVTYTSLNMVFWILTIVLIVAIIIRYVTRI